MYRGSGTVRSTIVQFDPMFFQHTLLKAVRPDFPPLDPENCIVADTGKAFRIAGQDDPRPAAALTRARLATAGVNHIAKRWDCNFRDACFLLAICLKTSLEEVARYIETGEGNSFAFVTRWCHAIEHLERYYPKGWREDDDENVSTDED